MCASTPPPTSPSRPFLTDTRLAPPADQPPPRKKSKWDDDEADLTAARELKRAKKAALAARLATEKERASRAAESSASASVSAATSREGTPARVEGQVRARRTPRRGREAHPLLESCRSVYSYEVRSRSCSTPQTEQS